ncbi:zinc finger B-box domain-containing protein 1 isoform X3 [Castor canadensis]|uniref:Zinc finger B-box domain-containing protein 1 isoform X3 n=1 Tax=Castor canadensis TaxID=51338 RepID=A0AC58MKL6_CASCN
MNTKDFVVLPWGKPGNSVKLKYKNAQELRMEKIQLELENQDMERKLQEFQLTRNKEKEEIKSSGYHWKSGKVSKLCNQSHTMSQNRGNAIKLSAGKVKLKLLKQQIQEPWKEPVNYKMANSSRSEKPKIKRKVCGQCENKDALLVCLECGEDYCSGCFAKIHQKGALKLHRTALLQEKSQILSSVLDVAHRFIKEVNPDEPRGINDSSKEGSKSQNKPKFPIQQESSSGVEITTKRDECINPKGRLLREGLFDEEASAQSFQEALSQWRAGTHNDQEKQNPQSTKPVLLGGCEVQTNLKIWREPINVEFTEDSLSYMEKLWLKKHRRTPQAQLVNMLPDTFTHSCETTSEAQCSQNEKDGDSEVEKIEVQYPTLFPPVKELNIERHEPCLKIIELDETYEEEFEEQGNTVPYKVELADAESQLSWTFPDYQWNSFPYENSIYQHRVFNTGKVDLLNLCLRNSSTYCKDNLKGESSSSQQNLTEKTIDTESHQKSDDFCITLESKDSLPSTDFDQPSIEEKLSQVTRESLEFSNLHDRPNLEDSTATKSPRLLEEIALRSKPITEQYQGLERFFTFEKNERLSLLPSRSSECNFSCTKITLTGDREWVPDSSLSAHADNAVALGVLQVAQNPPPNVKQQKKGQKSQRPSTANLPLSNSVKKSSICLLYPHPQSKRKAAQSLSRAASAISEIEYIDMTEHNDPFLDNTADQHTLDTLEKELNVLKNLADPSEKLNSLTCEELSVFNNDSLNISQIFTDFLNTAHVRRHCTLEELNSSGKDTAMQSLLSFSESSTDEEEEDFLDKQHVFTLPWSKSA